MIRLASAVRLELVLVLLILLLGLGLTAAILVLMFLPIIVRGKDVSLRVVAHRHVGTAHEGAVLVGARELAGALHRAVVAARGLVQLNTDLLHAHTHTENPQTLRVLFCIQR